MDGKKKNLDPLYQLFEHNLLHRSYEDSSAFTKEVAEEYMTYLHSTLAHIPYHVRTNVLEDLVQEAQELLVKKMYGCVKATDYQNFGKVMKVQKLKEVISIEFQHSPRAEEAKK